jgi:glycosyltransferase involved in cell wall biosynthesis
VRARPQLRLVFDADGLMADERVEFAGWRATGLQYRLFRDWEAQAVRRAEAVIVRTTHARRILAARAGAGVDSLSKIVVIPNGKDAAQFAPLEGAARAAVRARLGVAEEAPWVVYAGSLGPQYHAEAMLRLFARVHARRPDARLLLLSGMGQAVEGLLARQDAAVRAAVEVRRVAPDEVAPILGAASLGLSLREPSFSQQAVCPIKVAEYLLCGLPVVATAGVGDLDERLLGLPALRLLERLDDAALERAAAWFVDEALIAYGALRDAAREAGLREFALAQCAGALRGVLSDHKQVCQRS